MATGVYSGSTYGADVYGAGPYSHGVYTDTLPPPIISDTPAVPGRAAPGHAFNLLGIGPWADGIEWRALPNQGLVATRSYPAMPVHALTQTSSASFTLRRARHSEAVVDIDAPRGSSIVVEEMVTDLWWRRRNPGTGIVEGIGRFNADAVDVSVEGNRVKTTATFVDYRGMLEDRFVPNPTDVTFPAGKPVTDIIAAILHTAENTGIDMRALDTVNLGKIDLPFRLASGITMPDAIDAMRPAAPEFDWAVEMAEDGTPTLCLWPVARGSEKGVVLLDDGSGVTPIVSARRRTNRQDFATTVRMSGEQYSRLGVVDATNIPEGQRDSTASQPHLTTSDLIARAAQREVEKRAVRRSAWDITLANGFWRGRGHIDLGDPVRVVLRLGDDLLDETARVETIKADITAAAGVENVTISLSFGAPGQPGSRRTVSGTVIRKLEQVAGKPLYVPPLAQQEVT